ncbi:MAG: arginase family protein [Candidatus Thorarchaeota archaeon]|jgi:agmatinase
MRLRNELNGYLRLPRGFFGISAPDDGNPDVGVLGVPYDLTSSHMPGCRFGPDAIRAATDSERSHGFPLTIGDSESFDSRPLTKLITLEDIGDLEVMGRLPEAAMVDISEAAAKLASHESYLLFLGGDHFITYPLLKGLKRGRPGRYGIVYLDSHADLYEEYGGYSLSHATTLRRLIDEKLISVKDVIAYDLRTALPEQRELLLKNRGLPSSPEEFSSMVEELGDRVDVLYASVDLDVLRPDLVHGVGHPESGGLDMATLTTLLDKCFRTGRVRYADVTELNPLVDKAGLGAIAARDIVKSILAGFALQKGLN